MLTLNFELGWGLGVWGFCFGQGGGSEFAKFDLLESG